MTLTEVRERERESTSCWQEKVKVYKYNVHEKSTRKMLKLYFKKSF